MPYKPGKRQPQTRGLATPSVAAMMGQPAVRRFGLLQEAPREASNEGGPGAPRRRRRGLRLHLPG
ncbi:hypothetical protein MCOR25_005626 [Pyricularia grisea]|nr:hypothetical protein MCOR25_005626 [Pyricularia grisea]